MSTHLFPWPLGLDELPQDMLETLFRDGEIATAVTFEQFMDPDIHWITPAEYRQAFEELTDMSTTRTEAAWTNPAGGTYPPYINIQRDSDGAYMVSVRGQGAELPAQIVVPEEEWQQLLADAAMLRPGESVESSWSKGTDPTDTLPNDKMSHSEALGELAERIGEGGDDTPVEDMLEPQPIPEDAVHPSDAIVVEPTSDDPLAQRESRTGVPGQRSE